MNLRHFVVFLQTDLIVINDGCNNSAKLVKISGCKGTEIIPYLPFKFIVQMIASIATAIVTALGATSCMN